MSAFHVARAQGAFNVVSGAWPLLHMRSFEAALGPKVDRWLVRTVAGLLITNGLVQLAVPQTSRDAMAQARLLGIGTSATMLVIDLIYAPSGRISKIYLVDAVAEAGWLLAWLAANSERTAVVSHIAGKAKR